MHCFKRLNSYKLLRSGLYMYYDKIYECMCVTTYVRFTCTSGALAVADPVDSVFGC